MKTLLETVQEKRAALRQELDALIPAPGSDAEKNYSAETDKRTCDMLAELSTLDDRITQLQELEQREQAVAACRVETGDMNRPQGGATITSEPLTYTAESAQREGRSFVRDAYLAKCKSDYRAQERINRHQREMEIENRDLTTSVVGGLVIPQYLTDQYAALSTAGRPVANTVNNVKLPATGMTLNIPRGVTGTAVDVQPAQNTPLVEQDLALTTLAVPVVTVGGQQDVARQALERADGVDTLVFSDLVANFAVSIDKQVISGTGAGGQMLGMLGTAGIGAITYTTANPKAGELWGKFADAVSRVQASRYLAPTVAFMHPRRWAMIVAALDGSGRPLVNAGAPQNSLGTGDGLSYGQTVGSLGGMPIITDGNIPANLGAGANEDIIIIARAQDLVLWEDSPLPRQLRFEETYAGSLTVKLVVYGYAAFTAGRYPTSVVTIGGTGLVTPTF